MKADRIIAENTGMPAKGKKAPKPAEPVVTVPEGLTLGDVSFTVLGFRVSVRELNIKRIGRVKKKIRGGKEERRERKGKRKGSKNFPLTQAKNNKKRAKKPL